jgi:hypothetical protein
VRRAVDAATADLRAELDRLKGTAPRSDTAPASASPDKGTPDWKRFAGMPDAPKLEDFDSVSDHTAAMSHFIASAMLAEARQADQARSTATAREQGLQQKADQYTDRLRKAKDADPEFLTKIPPEVRGVTPLSGCIKNQAGHLVDPKTHQPVTFANVVVEAGFLSENPAALYMHLHANRGDSDRIAALPPAEWLTALIRLDGRLSGSAPSASAVPAAAAAPAEPKTLTDAPAPHNVTGQRAAETVDPMASAVKRGDTRAYRELKRGQRADRLVRR